MCLSCPTQANKSSKKYEVISIITETNSNYVGLCATNKFTLHGLIRWSIKELSIFSVIYIIVTNILITSGHKLDVNRSEIINSINSTFIHTKNVCLTGNKIAPFLRHIFHRKKKFQFLQ